MNRIPVAVDQLDAFKLQAKRFATVVSRLTHSRIRVRKSNRADFLAWACGYKNFSELALAARNMPPANAPLLLADTPVKRTVLQARCLDNPFGRLTPDVAFNAVSQLPTPVTPLVHSINSEREEEDEEFYIDPDDIEWIYQEFSFTDCPALTNARAAVKALNHASVFEQRAQVFSHVIANLSNQHAQKLRLRLEDLKPGAADTIDSLVSEIRSSTRRINQLRFDENPQSEITDVAALYTYWRHSSDIIGKGGVSSSAINRQFLRDASLAARFRPAYTLETAWPCPSCGSNARLTLSDMHYKNVDRMDLNCPQCHHVEQHRSYSRWSIEEPLNKFRCSCKACRDAVSHTAKALLPSSRTLLSDVAKWTRVEVEKEKSRLKALAGSVAARDVDAISPAAREFLAAVLGNPSLPIWREVYTIVSRKKYRRVFDRLPAANELLKELIAIGVLRIDFEDLIDDLNDEDSVIDCLFSEHADYFDRRRDHSPNEDRRWPYSGPWKGDWGAMLVRLAQGYRADDHDDFKVWLDALNESDLLSHDFRMPSALGLYVDIDRVNRLFGEKRHG